MPREDIVLANPWKTRIIAEAQIKTDKVDICGMATREIKEVVTQMMISAAAWRFCQFATMRRFRHKAVLNGRTFYTH